MTDVGTPPWDSAEGTSGPDLNSGGLTGWLTCPSRNKEGKRRRWE